jgi:flagellar biosynthesis GTPase FlhF
MSQTTTPTSDQSGTRTYRGRTIAELLPRIREELGDHAVVLRQRDGLGGGVGGFFQKAFVEVEARAGGPRVDVRDEAPAEPSGDPADDRPQPQAQDREESFVPLEAPPAANGFGHLLADAYRAAPDLFPDHVPDGLVRDAMPGLAAAENHASADAAPAPTRSKAAAAARDALVEQGVGAALAEELVAEAVTHGLPFGSPRSLRQIVRRTLARRLVAAPPRGQARAAIALVGAPGAGRTHVAARLALAYGTGSDVPVACVALRPADGGAELRTLLDGSGVELIVAADAAQARAAVERLGERGVAVLDVPAVSPRDADAVRALGRELSRAGVSERHLVLPATASAPALRGLLEGLRPLKPEAIALTHADQTDGIGAVLELAIRERLPISYVAGAGALEPADPAALARQLIG